MKKVSVIIYSCLLSSVCAWAQATGPTKVADQEFVTFAAQNDMAEAHLGQLAADHASSQAVKESSPLATCYPASVRLQVSRHHLLDNSASSTSPLRPSVMTLSRQDWSPGSP